MKTKENVKLENDVANFTPRAYVKHTEEQVPVKSVKNAREDTLLRTVLNGKRTETVNGETLVILDILRSS